MKINPYITLGAIAVTTFTGVGAASAATLGTINFGGTLSVEALGALFDPADPNSVLTTLEFNNAGLVPNPGSGQFNFTGGTGIFSEFNPPPAATGGIITDLPIDATPTFFPVDNFLSFAINTDDGSGVPNTFFDLDAIDSLTTTPTDEGVGFIFGVSGLFETPTGDFDGTGTFSADITFLDPAGNPVIDPTVTDFATFIDFLSVPGNRIDGISYSADFVAVDNEVVVPEASNVLGLLGLGLLGGTMVARKKKSS